MSINVNDKNLGHATAYAYYKAGGGTMTEAEFTEFMADFGTASQTAVEAAQAALASKNAAQTAATTATNKATEATTAAQTATTKAAEASTSASTATSAKDTAVSAASTATTKATEATTAAATATSAKTDAVAANTAAQSAKTAAQTAQTGAETAAASVSASAEQIATNAADISQLKKNLTALAPKEDMLKSFPTDTASGSVASFADGANVPVKSLIVNIDPVQEGSGDPSPDNIRPINGCTGANVQRVGKNLAPFNVSNVKKTNGYPGNYTMSFADDKITVTVTGSGANWFVYKVLHVTPQLVGKTVFATWDSLPVSTDKWLYLFDPTTSSGSTIYADHTTITAEMIGKGLCLFIKVGSVGTHVISNIQAEFGSTATPYEPYSGETINVDWTTEAGTVYGGTLDVTNGVLTVDMAMKTIGDCVWQVVDGYTNVFRTNLANKKAAPSIYMCTSFNPVSPDTTVSSMPDKTCKGHAYTGDYAPFFYIKDTDYTTANDFKQANASQKIVYEVATPLTIQLTPREVRSLLGSNNVWADSGDSAVEYRADPTLYLQRLTEPDADMIADANITSGSYFMVGNTLYKATANIASGATISPNVNCTRKSLSEALNELNA